MSANKPTEVKPAGVIALRWQNSLKRVSHSRLDVAKSKPGSMPPTFEHSYTSTQLDVMMGNNVLANSPISGMISILFPLYTA